MRRRARRAAGRRSLCARDRVRLDRAARASRRGHVAAKRANVTLALRNAPGTFAASDARLQTRSERGRLGVAAFRTRPAQFDAAERSRRARGEHRAAVERCEAAQRMRYDRRTSQHSQRFADTSRSTSAAGDATRRELRSAMRSWRIALRRKRTQPHIASCAPVNEPAFSQVGAARAPVRQAFRPAVPSYPELVLPRS